MLDTQSNANTLPAIHANGASNIKINCKPNRKGRRSRHGLGNIVEQRKENALSAGSVRLSGHRSGSESSSGSGELDENSEETQEMASPMNRETANISPVMMLDLVNDKSIKKSETQPRSPSRESSSSKSPRNEQQQQHISSAKRSRKSELNSVDGIRQSETGALQYAAAMAKRKSQGQQ